jgi:glycosyltransferase involved in cell wall biosynthesis
MRVLVVTIVHHPQDARILHRQIAALRGAGHQVTYAAPFTAYGVERPAGLATRDLPRARGRHRLKAVAAASRLLRREAPLHDVVLLHDPELLAAAWRLPARSASDLDAPVVVWDVHEDTTAAMAMKGWIPQPLRDPAAGAFRRVERAASGRYRLLLAEHRYADRFEAEHPVVPNSTRVPAHVQPPGDGRVVYLGTLTRARGGYDLIQVGRLLRGSGVALHLIGPAPDNVLAEALTAAESSGDLIWHGFVPNDRALELLSGAMAGLSLLHDEANYRHSQPTKVIEYMARGLPVVTTPNPLASELVRAADCGVVVPFEAPAAAAEAVRELAADPALVARLAANGRATALADHNWDADGPAFVRVLEGWAEGSA